MKKHSKKVKKNRDLLALEQRFEPSSLKGAVKVCLVYPNTYKAGMSSLGFQTLYGLIGKFNQISCERAFLSEKNGEARSLETDTKLSLFDIIMFSISFENDYINLVPLLQDAGIPLRSSGRNKFHPLVIAGGISCFLNPEPIAPFMDCILFGEAENFLKNFFNIFNKRSSKEENLTAFQQNMENAYISSYYKTDYKGGNLISKPYPKEGNLPLRIQSSYVKDLDKISTTSSVLTCETTFKNTFLIETGRGCPHGCRFCSAGFIYRPPRFYSKENILSSVKKGKELTDKIGFVSAGVSDHPQINELCEKTLQLDVQPSFSSFRADILSSNVLSSIADTSIKTATIAPEAGSQKMRDIINKNISEKEILNCTEYLVNAGIFNLRLYFLIGLPFEKEDDIHEIVELIKKIKERFLSASKKQKKIGTITVSINPFIPKPSTPFQWSGFMPEKVLKKRIKMINDSIKKIPNVKMKVESVKQSKINAFLSRADRKASFFIEQAYETGWGKALKQDKDYVDFVIHETWETDMDLPWDIVDTGLKKSFLINEFKRAEKGKTTLPCPVKECRDCKICKEVN